MTGASFLVFGVLIVVYATYVAVFLGDWTPIIVTILLPAAGAFMIGLSQRGR